MGASADHALQALIARFGARVRAQIVRHRLDRHGIDVDDIEQEVRIRLWNTLQRDPKALLPASYVQRTVTSVLVDAVRRAEARPAEALPEEPDLLDAEPLGQAPQAPEAEAEDRQLADAVATAIAALPERRRRPLQLYLQGFTVPEVAELCGLSFDAGRKLVYRGLDELKARLRAEGWEKRDD
ncbi:RNA polymerase sigma factor [Pseudomarimonas salicorniae]|uniref:Sigma-70 family RNA polymerase sigma factor n=1 Tax=Pseudomarimonas salicorniae TaxID=2933270 RepID=A0ABT0GCG2_9GAMM|nr:sigma-70 family RNA polymerase sigma factor [Lysobacter sp. CAU 1642]MCK7592123.1 sigma-70 family RNA polymerase sigma factor [Lysobacter sp. CAU 1642]